MTTETERENEMLCERLLGWKAHRRMINGHMTVYGWVCLSRYEPQSTPTFLTWAEAGLLLDWFMTHIGPDLESIRDGLALNLRGRTLSPEKIRAAALTFARGMK